MAADRKARLQNFVDWGRRPHRRRRKRRSPNLSRPIATSLLPEGPLGNRQGRIPHPQGKTRRRRHRLRRLRLEAAGAHRNEKASGEPVTGPGIPPEFPNPESLITDDCIRPAL